MAAQPNFWGTMDRSSRRAQRDVSKHRQEYRQPSPVDELRLLNRNRAALEEPQPIAEVRSNPLASFIAEFERENYNPLSAVLASMNQLIAADPDEIPATTHAYQNARAVVEAAYGRLAAKSQGIPAPIVVTDDIGGVRVLWQLGERHVRTLFGATDNQNSYLYFESPTEHATEALQPTVLSSRLEWMTKP